MINYTSICTYITILQYVHTYVHTYHEYPYSHLYIHMYIHASKTTWERSMKLAPLVRFCVHNISTNAMSITSSSTADSITSSIT